MKKIHSLLVLIGFCIQIFSPLIGIIQNSNTIKNKELTISVSNKKNTICLHDFNVATIITNLVEQAINEGFQEELSKALLQCYQSIIEDDGIIDIETTLEAMPELLEYTVETEKLNRGIRPNAPTANNHTAIASCSQNDCDLTQVIRLLRSINSSIGTVQDSPCCNTILGILGDACSIPCIGDSSSISEVLCEILNCCTIASDDIKSIFTTLTDIENTLTFICDKIETGFDGTFTTLTDIENTLTFICDKIETGFDGTFTTLTDVENTLTFICEKIETGFDGTFTLLADIENTLTFICDKIEIGFDGTFTTLTDIENTLTFICEKIETGFDGTFTTLTDIENTLTFICEKIETGFNGTFTVLNNLNLTMSVDFTGIFTVLNECCACNPIPLFQSDVAGGQITLSTAGQNYCLAENITGDIIISGANVSLDGNDRVVRGRIEINNEEIIIKNTKVKPVAPTANPINEAGIQVLGVSSTNVQIINCLVECDDTSAATVEGRTAISSQGAETLVERCIAKAGAAGERSGINGAKGIELQGDNSLVLESEAIGGEGALGTSGVGSGNGGNGIEIQGNGSIISKSQGTGGQGGENDFFGLPAGNGGNGISTQGDNNTINESEGTGGEGGLSSDTDNGGIAGDGGSGIEIQGNNSAVNKSIGLGGIGGIVAPASGTAGNGGNGIEIRNNNNTIKTSQFSGGNGALSLAAGGNGGNGILITDVNTIIIKACCIVNGSNGGNSFATGGDGGNGILISTNASNIQICECKINNVGAAGTGTPNGSPGNGIQIDSDAVCVQIISNRIACCEGIGINNEAGTESTLYNNIATDNSGGNYSGVTFVRTPGPQTCFYVNVTDGPEDCDLCSIFTQIACNPIPLFQSNVDDDGEIKLTEAGISYCLAENITGTIIITGSNITVDGNDRILTGRVEIQNEEAIIKNAKIKPQAPTTNLEAAQAAIEILSTGSQTQIINCLIECENTTTTVPVATDGILGRGGITSAAEGTIIENCIIVAGAGGNGGDGNDGGQGGNGIDLNSNNNIVGDSIITAGDGGSAGSLGNGGTGGNGIFVNGENCIVVKTITTGGSSISNEENGGNGGNGILISGNNTMIKKTLSTGGNGSNGGDGTPGGNGGNGGDGILNSNNDTILIINSKLNAGNGGNGGNGGEDPADGGNAGNGGNGLSSFTARNLQVLNTQITPGNSGIAGDATLPNTGGNGGDGGNGISISENEAIIINSCIITDGGNGTNGGLGTPGGNGGNGGNGIIIVSNSSNIQICNSKISNIGFAGIGTINGLPGNGIIYGGGENAQIINNIVMNVASRGISVNSEFVEVRDCSALDCGNQGFFIGSSAVNCILMSCRSTSNDIGFDVDGGSTGSDLINSYAADNTTSQYVGVIFVTLPADKDFGYWANVQP